MRNRENAQNNHPRSYSWPVSRNLAQVAALAIGMASGPAFAAPHLTSTNVAVIPNYTGSGFGGGTGGTFNPAFFPSYAFTTITPPMVTSWESLSNYDTIIIYQFCNINSFPPSPATWCNGSNTPAVNS